MTTTVSAVATLTLSSATTNAPMTPTPSLLLRTRCSTARLLASKSTSSVFYILDSRTVSLNHSLRYGSSAMAKTSSSSTASISGALSSALSSASSSASAASSSAASAQSSAASSQSSVQSSASRSAASAASSASAAATETGAAAHMAVPAAGVFGIVLGAAALL